MTQDSLEHLLSTILPLPICSLLFKKRDQEGGVGQRQTAGVWCCTVGTMDPASRL